MDKSNQEQRDGSAVQRMLRTFLSRLRRLVGVLIQFAQRDQLSELEEQTRRLGSASVEASVYTHGELKAIEERLARIERELAALRRASDVPAAGSPEPAERPDDVVA
jgi:hypothetical protein